MVRCPPTPACPASTAPSPTVVLPEIPTWEIRITCRPIRSLCPTCTRLSILVPSPIIVLPIEPRSIVVLHPISTSLPRTHPPTCGRRRWPPSSQTNPNPSFPTLAPLCMTQRSPTTTPAYSVAWEWITQSRPTRVPAPTTECAPTCVPSPRCTPDSITAQASILTPGPISASS